MLRRKKQSFMDSVVYYVGISAISFFKHIPYPMLKRLGKGLGSVIFHVVADYRKTALTNLALAFPNKSFEERRAIAKASIQNVMVTILELLAVETMIKQLDNLITIATEETKPDCFSLNEVLTQKELDETFASLNNEGLILFCGHQANWELPFLFITRDYPGLALAKPIKNARLNEKIFALREIFKGKIVAPKQGIQASLKALQQGHLVGIVGDQSLLISSYSYPLFGHTAFTTTSPALLAYKTGKPVAAISVLRHEQGYTIVPSKKFYADKTLPMKESINSLMDNLMRFLEKSIADKPEQWMWMHKRWKRKLNKNLKKKHSYSHILVIVNSVDIDIFGDFLINLAHLYTGADLTLALINSSSQKIDKEAFSNYSVKEISNVENLKTMPNCFPAVFDLFDLPRSLKQHFKRTGSLELFSKDDLKISFSKSNGKLSYSLNDFLK